MKPFPLLFLLLFPALLSAQTRYYVHPLASGTGTGLSWTDAFTDLHDALAVAQKGDEIWVAQGTYYPSLTGNRSARFVLLSGVRLYGGFRGTELDLSERDWEAHPTVIDGDIGIPGDSTDNTRTLLYLPWPDSSTVVDGLVFRNGVANDTLLTPRSIGNCGGALFIQGINGAAYANIRNCVFQRNTAIYCGGAVYIHGAATGSVAPAFVNCRFEGNRAVDGPGGAIHRYGSSLLDRIDIIKCVFHRNVARHLGGAVYWWAFDGSDNYDVHLSYFEKNSVSIHVFKNQLTPGERGGKVLGLTSTRTHGNTTLNFLKCSFKHNDQIETSLISGEAVLFLAAPFILNIREGHSYQNIGAGLFSNGFSMNTYKLKASYFIEDATPYIRSDIEFDEDDDENNFSSLEEVYFINVIGKVKPNSLNTFTTFFSLNRGLVVKNAFFDIDIDLLNIGLANKSSIWHRFRMSNVITNSIKERLNISVQHECLVSVLNSSFHNHGLIVNLPTTDSEVILKNNAFNKVNNWNIVKSNKVTFSHNLLTTPDPFPDAPAAWVKANNLFETDPMFVQPDSGDFRLQPCSPAINAGTNSAVDWSTDLFGNPRIQYGTVDIGAVEMGPLAFDNGGPAVRPACPGLSTGRIDASALPVCSPATFTWSTGSSSAVVENLPAGAYTLSVVDAKGRDGVFVLQVPSASSPVLTPQSLPVQCGDTLGGTAAVVVSSAPGPFAFQWAGLSADSLQTNLSPGLYRVTVTDAYGCTAEGSVKVDRLGALSIQIDVQPIQCPGSADGFLTVLPANGKPPFTWAWSQSAGAAGPTAGPLGPGLYIGTLTDAFGCQIGWSLPLTEPVPLSAQITVVDATDTLAANGSIQLALSGGAGGYTVQWSNGGTGLHLLGLRPGVYVATVTDANGCVLVTPPITVGVKVSASEVVGVLSGARLQPNPAGEGTGLSLRRPLEREMTVRLWTSEGRLVRSWVLPAGVQQWWLPLQGVPAGAYSVEVEGAALPLVKWK
jgi:hypothetical protein